MKVETVGENNRKRTDRMVVRDSVIRAAGQAFAQKGIKQVRMDDLATTLSISKRTIYELFQDKEQLLLEVVKRNHEEMNQYLKEVSMETDNVMEIIVAFYQKSIEQLQQTNVLFFEDLERYPRIESVMKSERLENTHRASAFFQRGIEQGIFLPHVRYDLLEFFFEEQMRRVLHSDILRTYTLSQVFETFILVIMRGISTQKGLKIIDDYLASHN